MGKKNRAVEGVDAVFPVLRMLISGERSEASSSLTQHSQGILCQSEHGLLAEALSKMPA